MMSIGFSPAGIPTAIGGDAAASVPSELRLEQNFPNPFNPTTKIGFTVPGPEIAQVKLSVYDVLGKEVAVLVDGPLSPGYHSRTFDGRSLASGVYVYRLQVVPSASAGGGELRDAAHSLTKTGKAILLR
jgi:hypothetical protein